MQLPKTKTLFHQFVEDNNLMDDVPSLKVKKVVSGSCTIFTGPHNPEEPGNNKEFAQSYAQSTSLYPCYSGHATREGDPICDSYRIHTYEHGTVVFCLADGCNWGERPREASNRYVTKHSPWCSPRSAKDTFVHYCQQKLTEPKNLKDYVCESPPHRYSFSNDSKIRPAFSLTRSFYPTW